MSEATKILIEQALELPSAERAIVAEQLLLSLDHPGREIDAIWASEAEARIENFDRGTIEAIPASEVFGKYDQE